MFITPITFCSENQHTLCRSTCHVDFSWFCKHADTITCWSWSDSPCQQNILAPCRCGKRLSFLLCPSWNCLFRCALAKDMLGRITKVQVGEMYETDKKWTQAGHFETYWVHSTSDFLKDKLAEVISSRSASHYTYHGCLNLQTFLKTLDVTGIWLGHQQLTERSHKFSGCIKLQTHLQVAGDRRWRLVATLPQVRQLPCPPRRSIQPSAQILECGRLHTPTATPTSAAHTALICNSMHWRNVRCSPCTAGLTTKLISAATLFDSNVQHLWEIRLGELKA